jgi:hypothetical protein
VVDPAIFPVVFPVSRELQFWGLFVIHGYNFLNQNTSAQVASSLLTRAPRSVGARLGPFGSNRQIKKIKDASLIHHQRRRFRDAKLNRRVLRTFWSLIELL